MGMDPVKKCPKIRGIVGIGAAGMLAVLAIGEPLESQQPSSYFPGPGGQWETRAPEEVGMDPDAVRRAVEVGTNPENVGFLEDLELMMLLYPPGEPLNELVGPTRRRGPPAGVVVRNGYIVAEWGETERVDMTFSVTKSFITTTVGLAYDDGLIEDLHRPVHESMAPVTELVRGAFDRGSTRTWEPFSSEHNRKITWDHLLRQTSDWHGTLWEKPDWVDRPRGEASEEWVTRDRHEPGTVFEYNDVRVNVTALASANVWRRPLPEVLRERIMDPIDASSTWRWHGYDNSWILMDGSAVQVPSGGGHWGGGMWITARDQARFGLLFMHNGQWNGRQLLSDEFIRLATTPGEVNEGSGFMNFTLNTNRRGVPAAPETAFWHSGGGINRIYVDRENDLVVVVRWIEGRSFNELISHLIEAIQE